MEHFPAGAARIAFFGGSFDPPHLGHLAVARAARAGLALDTVLFAPVGAQPLKPQGSTAGFQDRLEMTRLAIAGEPGFAISLADAPNDLGAPNYTLETLFRLRDELPEGGALFCLMGADSFLGLRHWHRAAEIPFAAPLVVASRPSLRPSSHSGPRPLDQLPDLAAALPAGLTIEPAQEVKSLSSGIELLGFRLRNPSGDSALLYLLPGLHIEISATQIREQVCTGSSALTGELTGQLTWPEVLPAAVAGYIRSHGLYR
jgi:nicotinate-nucleotide adenylyltransferase